jgi:AcrR family transcriptional regulator
MTNQPPLHPEQVRFVDALIGVASQAGTFDVRVGDVVEAAGSCRAAFYRSFETKDDLLLAAIGETARRIAAAVWRDVPKDPTPAQIVAAWVRLVLRPVTGRAKQRPPSVFALDRHRLAAQYPEQSGAAMVVLTEPLRVARQRAGRAPADLVVEAVSQMVLAIVGSRIASNRWMDADAVATVADLCTRMTLEE